MPFDNSLIGSDDFDPRTATEDLIRQQTGEPLPAVLEPRMLNTRLARKMGQQAPKQPRFAEELDDEPAVPKQPAAGELDFSAQAIPPGPDATSGKVDNNLDFSAQAAPADAPIVPPPPSGLATYATEFGKGVAEGAKGLPASALKGAAAVYDKGTPETPEMPVYDAMGNVTGFTTPPQAAVPSKPVPERTLYKAGEALDKFGKEALAPAPGFENSWTRDIGAGAGSMLAGIPIAMIPGVGPAVGGAIWTLAGSGEATENAVKAGATTQQTELAALLGGPAGATDMVDMLLPSLGTPGRVLGFVKRVGVAAVKGALMEGGQEGVQQLMQNAIAKGIYKPDQDMFEDVPRSVAIAALLGGVVGGASGALHGDNRTAPPPAPPPNAGALPGSSPRGPGPSSPEDIADFVRQAQQTNPNPQQANAAPDPATMSDAERIDAFNKAREAFDGAGLDDILRQGGWMKEAVAQMDEQTKIDEAIKIGREKVTKTGKFAEANETGDTTGQQGTATKTGPDKVAPGQKSAAADQMQPEEYAVLRAYGYSDEDIGNMSRRQRLREVIDAQSEGIDPKDAVKKYPMPQQAAPTGSDVDRNGAAGTRVTDTVTDTGQNTPETFSTLKAQQAQMLSGERPAQMFPKGTQELDLPAGLRRVETPRGVFHFDPAKISAEQIKQLSAEGRENQILGLGSFSKQDIAGKDGDHVVVVERAPDGTEIRSAVGTTETAAQQRAELDQGKSQGNTVSVETAADVLDGRRAAGTREDPVEIKSAQDVEAVTRPASGDYSHAQGEANNRQLGHGTWNGLPVSLEVAKGGTRKMVNPENGQPVEVSHRGAAYGYFKGTKGADGMHVDLYMGEHPESPTVYVIDEIDRGTGKFRQHKVMGGFTSERDAFAAYVQTSTKGPETVGGITAMSVPELKTWLDGDTTQPLKTPMASTSREGEEAKARLPLTEVADAGAGEAIPKVSSTEGGGTVEVSESKTTESEDRSNNISEKVEPTAAHVSAIEDVLGDDADRVAVVDIQRAAEIMAENDGIDAGTAFQHAVIENAVEDGFITEQQAVEAYGEEAKDILESGRESASGGSRDTEQERAAPDEVGAGGATETGVVPGGSEGVSEVSEREADTEVADGEQYDTGRTEPDTKRETSGDAADKAATATEAANRRHGYAVDRATNERWNELVTATIDEVHPGDIFNAVRLNVERGALSVKNARKLLDGLEEEEIPKEESIDILARSKIEQLQGGRVVQFPYKDEQAQGRMWATIVGFEDGYITTRGPTKKLEALIASPPAPLPEPGKERLEDAGEKIGGARKDAFGESGLSYDDLKGMTEIEQTKAVNKQNVFPRPDYVAMVDGGVQPVAAALVKRIYDRLPTKPNSDRSRSEDDTKDYIDGLKKVRDILRAVRTQRDAESVDNRVDAQISWSKKGVLYPLRSTDNPFYLSSQDIRAAERAVASGFPNMEPWTRLFEVRKQNAWEAGKVVATKFNVYRKNGGLIASKDTHDEAVAAAKAAYEGLSEERKKGGEEPNRPHLDEVRRSGPDYREGRDVTGDDFVKDFGFRGVEFGNWVAGDERQKSVNLAYDALQDLARVMNVPPKAISLDGSLSIAFGARGRGGKAAAHYEPGRIVMNMTKIQGAGSLAHEFAHALDHYLGNLGGSFSDQGVKSISGWDQTQADGYYKQSEFQHANRSLPLKLRAAVNRLMHDLFSVEETDEANEKRLSGEIENANKALANWQEHRRKIIERKAKGESGAGMKQADDGIAWWQRKITALERQREAGKKIALPSQFLENARTLSGASGDYWRRPNEMFARSFESYVFDKLAEAGFESQYLVQGVEPTRFGAGFKGNPYPAGEERERINADYGRIMRALTVGEGKLGAGTRIIGDPGPVETVEVVKKPTPQPSAKEEAAAVMADSTNLAGSFEAFFATDGSFKGILEARKYAKDRGYSDDAKAVEEALELAIVRTARRVVDGSRGNPAEAYKKLIALYGRQPRLGTRTSTSVRDQAYSTPVPLAYLAARLADITKETTVYEPTAGNGALLITADPHKTTANEINQERRANLRGQGFAPMSYDASTDEAGNQIHIDGVDRVIANPPFGAVRQEGESKVFDLSDIQKGYQTHEIDHAIALKALESMKDDGRAVLILGGVNKMVTGDKARSDAYNGKAKREFFLTLYGNYGVTDHFTVAGELYERQGAGWPVDVIVIDGRRKSSRPLPAVQPPRIYETWDSLGGLLNGQQANGGVRPAGNQADNPAGVEGLESPGAGDRGLARGDGAGLEQPASVRGKSGGEASGAGATSGVTGDEPGGRGQVDGRARAGEQPAAVEDFDAAFDAALDDAYGAAPVVEPAFPNYSVDDLQKTLAQGERVRAMSPATVEKMRDELARRERSNAEVAKSAVKNATNAADEAFSALYDLFGGPKASSGFTFDEETYAKAKPHFEAAAGKFADVKSDLGELLRRMVGHMREALKWPREVMERIRPYIKRFVEELRAPAPKEAIKPQATETENQVVYKPRSGAKGLDTLAPVNMAKPMADSIDALEARVGPVDSYVAKELGYNEADLPNYFGAEQVDALGLAIDNIKRGRGFIIGDQTGIGKGRVNAAIIRWAIKNDRIPVFVTEKPNLYKDMFRDLMDIGITDNLLDDKPRVLATNSALKLPLEDGNGARIDTGDTKTHNKHMIESLNNFGDKYDMVFTTYNQMQTLKGEDTDRRKFLQLLSQRKNGIVLIIDESHNAGGQKVARKAKGDAPGRAEFTRDLIEKANGVFYSSATYAKRPDVMDLYAATDMAMAVDNLEDLSEAIARGGVPMQQAVASMLAKAGQYVRRERSFAGINYNTPIVPVARETYDGVSRALAAIQDLSKVTARAAETISAQLRAEGNSIGYDGSLGDAGASSTNFTAIMHNVINQMLLAMKVGRAAEMAIETIKRGEKPVLTVANTMEAFLDDYADQLGLKPGDEMSGDFSHVLKKYLDRNRTVLIKKPFKEKGDKPVRHYLTDSELGPAGVAVYDNAKAIIEGMDLSGLPISPIDYLKGQLKKAGYEVGEITGRTLSVDYTGDVPRLATRPGADKTAAGKSKTIKAFNTRTKKGGTHAMVINQSGSTGLSLHASVTFDDQSKRRMLVVQPEGNIDTHMQLLGRINRTGQVVLPEYDQLVLDAPAEKRPAAVLSKKMASLNANTTASRSSAVTAKDVPDFINDYGDEIAANWVRDNMETHFKLASPVKISEEGKVDKVDAMRKLTGRIPLLRMDQQEALYDQLESEYAALLQQLEAAGENALEARSLDLKARLVEWMEVQGKRNDSGSPFAAPVILQKVSIARTGKPFKPAEIMSRLSEAMGGNAIEDNKYDAGTLANMLGQFSDPYSVWGKKVQELEIGERKGELKRFDAYMRPVIDAVEDPEERAKQLVKFNANKDRWATIHQMLPIGRRVVIKTATNNLTGIVLEVYQTGQPKNPLAMGSWKATFAIADASRQMTIPFGRMFENGKSDPESSLDVEIEPMTNYYERNEATLERFQHMQSEAREDRWIAGGNILSAYDWMDRKGSIINYTSYKGSVHQGVLTARGFEPRKQALAHGVIEKDTAKIKAWLDDTVDRLHSADGNISVQKDGRHGTDYVLTASKAKAKGGVYFLDQELTKLTGEFISKGGNMVAYARGRELSKVLDRLMKLGAKFKMPAKPVEVHKVGQGKGEGEEPSLASPAEDISADMGRRQQQLKNLSAKDRAEIDRLVREAVRNMVGQHVSVELSDDFMDMSGEASEKWGGGDHKAAALYFPRRALIRMALVNDLASTIPHEAYHAVEYQLQTPDERKLMERETPRLREDIRAYAKAKYKIDDATVDGLAGEEVRAIGMEAFMAGKLNGAHIGVRRWYQKLIQMLRRLANALHDLGYQTAEDIYGKVKSGGYRNASGATPRPEADVSLAAIGPAGRSGPPPMSETIAAHLRDRGYDRLAGLSNKLGIGRFNTTEARTLVQDKFIRVRNAESSVGGVPSVLSAYQAESLYYGRTGERLEELEKTAFDPLIEDMKKSDVSLGELNGYLYAQHASERNAYIDTINPNLNGEGSGMSDADAAAILAGIPAAKQADYDRLAARVQQIIADTRDTLVSYGLISQETADAWASQYSNYVPLRGFAEGTEDEEGPGRGKGYDQRAKVTKAAFGRASEADGPLQYVMMQAESAIVRGEKNRVGNTFYRFVRANPDPARWQINAPTLKRRIDARTGLVTYYADFNYHNEPDAFVTRIGGKPFVIRLYGKDGLNIARSLKQMGTSTMNAVVKVLHTLTTLQARLSTQWNPNFTLPNFARDLGEAFINLQAQDQARFTSQFAKHVLPAMKGAFQALAGRQGGTYADAFREFDRVGGRIRFFGLDDVEDIKANVTRKMRRLEGGLRNRTIGALSAVGNGFEIVNGAVENAPRLAAYMAARDVGMSQADAAMLARNLTVDFNKKGEWGPAINAAFMFANASVQGTARLGKAFQYKRVRQAAYGLVAMGAAGALYNLLAGGDDDDGTPYYAKIKPYIRDKNIIFMWPKGFGADGQYVKIPLPYGFSPFHVIGDRAVGVALGKDKVSDAAYGILSSVADAFNPLGDESSLAMMLVPTLLRPGIHIAVNKNWTGAPLYPDHDYDKQRPDSEKSFRSNSAFSKAAAKDLNAATGGNPYRSGWADVHAGSIDHVIETVTGGLGKFIGDVVKTGGAVISGEPFNEGNAPIIKRFVGTAKDPRADAAAYYEAREEARKSGGENLNAARKDVRLGRNAEEAQSFVNESRSAVTGENIFKRADQQMKPLRAQLERVEASSALSAEQKRQETAAIQERMRQVQNRARKDYRQLKEGTAQ